MSSADVHPAARSALRTHLEAMPGMLPVAQRAYEGFTFGPTRGQPFIEDRLVVNHGTPIAHSAIDHGMSYILTLKYPSDQGTAAIEAMAGLLLDRFKVGTKLTYGARTVLCYRAERRGGIVQETDWQVLTVTVVLQTFTTE